jgi:anti-sigma-K factor RskA
MRHEHQQSGPLEPQDVEELLPWYVTGRVSREEARGIEAALKTMPDLADKLAQAQRERDAVARAAETIEPPPPETLQNLLQQVETTRQVRPSRADSAGQPGGWLADAFNRNLVWQGAFAVASVAIVALGVRLYTLPTAEPFGVASDSPATNINGAASPTLLVTFQPDATAGQITALLRELDAVVADGPKPDGAFVIHLPRAQDVTAAITALEARKDLVASVLDGS